MHVRLRTRRYWPMGVLSMLYNTPGASPRRTAGAVYGRHDHRAFSLIELLTVMFIIALLIAILVPSLNSARNSAKKTSSNATLQAIKVGLDMFKNENERDFPQSNGYPPSFAHPIMRSDDGTNYVLSQQQSLEGRYPFLNPTLPVVFGAQWLPAMLMGADQQGYIQRSAVPRQNKFRDEPWKWYEPDALGTGKPVERRPLYVDGVRTVITQNIVGKPNQALFPNWLDTKGMPVIVDAFDQPILYYAANSAGRGTNLVAEKRDLTNTYAGGTQETGPPYYFHEDNHAFTGDETEPGWDLGEGGHWLQEAGEDQDADAISLPFDPDLKPGDPGYRPPTFARFILDRAQLRTFEQLRLDKKTVDPNTPLIPANPKSYLLISPGVDAKYGTPDDVTNFPLSVE